jgi:hypothetical protein
VRSSIASWHNHRQGLFSTFSDDLREVRDPRVSVLQKLGGVSAFPGGAMRLAPPATFCSPSGSATTHQISPAWSGNYYPASACGHRASGIGRVGRRDRVSGRCPRSIRIGDSTYPRSSPCPPWKHLITEFRIIAVLMTQTGSLGG